MKLDMPDSETDSSPSSEPQQKTCWVKTNDGSLSCREPESGLLCHNRAGAYLEATENYASPSGLDGSVFLDAQTTHQPIHVLDSCYGLGYNTWALIGRLLESYPGTNPKNAQEQCRSPLLRFTAIEKSPTMLKMSADVFANQGFGTLHQLISPLEHNAYYRTLLYFLESGLTRFKVALLPVKTTEVDSVDAHGDRVVTTDVLKTDKLGLCFQFYIRNEEDNSWLPFSLPVDRSTSN